VLTNDVLRMETSEKAPQARIEAWLRQNAATVNRCRQILSDLRSAGKTDFTMLSVAMREIRGMRTMEVPRSESAGAAAKPAAKPPSKSKKPKAKGEAA